MTFNTSPDPTIVNIILDVSVILIALKLLNLLSWPWIWVLSPIWISVSIFAIIVGILILFAIIEAFTK
jgi:hypothetical protein